MGWIDTTVVGIIIVGGLIIMYKALKEPIDLIFSLIARGFQSLIGAIQGGIEKREIRYE